MRITVESDRSKALTWSLSATYCLASVILIFLSCIRATRSPAARMPPIDEANGCAMCMPVGSPVPTYNPSALPISIMAALRAGHDVDGGASNIGTPPTPMPTLGWMGILASRCRP